MLFREILPDSALRSHIQSYWEFDATALDGEPFIHHVVPDGCISLVFLWTPTPSHSENQVAAPTLVLLGPRLTELQIPIHPGRKWWGIRFWPDAAGAIFRTQAKLFKDQLGPASHFIPTLSSPIERLFSGQTILEGALPALNTFWKEHIELSMPLDPIVRACVKVIIHVEGQIVVSEIAHQLELSERQLTRRFQNAVGLMPKQFARIRRLRSSASAVLEKSTPKWSRIAMELGYADQAHMTREFSELVGLSPKKFQARIARIEHRDVTP